MTHQRREVESALPPGTRITTKTGDAVVTGIDERVRIKVRYLESGHETSLLAQDALDGRNGIKITSAKTGDDISAWNVFVKSHEWAGQVYPLAADVEEALAHAHLILGDLGYDPESFQYWKQYRHRTAESYAQVGTADLARTGG